MRPHRAFARQNALGYWVGCIEYPCGMVSAVTNAKHTEGAALEIAQRMSEGADELWTRKERRHDIAAGKSIGTLRAGLTVSKEEQ